jgi:adenylate cyclase
MRERPNNPDATDLAMRGWTIINRPVTKASLDDAIALFDRSLSVDPQNFRALNGLAWALAWRANSSWSDDRESDVGRAEKAINAALALEPNSSSAHRTKGWVFFAQRQMGPALAEAQTAIADDSNNADAQALMGLWKMFVGQSEDGLADVETAFRLSPRDPQLPYWQFYMCHLHTHLAQWEKSIDWCSKSTAGGNAGMFPYVDLVAANAWAGHDGEAKQAAARLQKVYPGFTVQTWASIHWSDDPTFNAQYQRIVEGLRKAGLPEGEAKKD